MKKLLFLIFLSSTKISFAQFAIITDKDGHTNIRKGGSKAENIIDKLQNGHLIYCLEKKHNWINIDYTKDAKECNGYIYADRCVMISNYSEIPILTQSENLIKLSKDSIEIIITQKLFDKLKHKFKYYKDANDQIELIDNKKYWGDDGGMPKKEYQSIKIKIRQRIINLPKSALENLYEPDLALTQVNYDHENNVIYVHSMNSDGAGYYEVIWKIERGIYKERFIAYGF